MGGAILINHDFRANSSFVFPLFTKISLHCNGLWKLRQSMFLSKVLMLRYTPGTNRRLLRFLIEFAHCHRNLAKLTPISIVAGSNRKCNIETTQREDCTMHIASFKWCVGDNNVVWKSVAGFHFLYFEHTSYPVFRHPRNIYTGWFFWLVPP